jgi:molybdenum cofactor cytidylyltransferase
MRIRSLPIEAAVGHILIHNIGDGSGQKVLKKGTPLTEQNIATLRELGYASIEVGVLARDDMLEDEAAVRIAAALVEGAESLSTSHAVGGRVNIHAERDGLLYVEAERLAALNALPGVTLATRCQHALVGPSHGTTQLATLKIIPYALPQATVEEAVQLAGGLLRVAELQPRRVALLITAEAGSAARIQRQFEGPTRARLQRLGSALATVECVAQDEAAIAGAVQRLLAAHEALIIGGQTSIMDIEDTTLRALAQGGAEIALHGAPVEPGNLLALAYQGSQWILCAPGCAKSPSHNVVDLVLPRLLAGERLGRAEIARLGLGGLL